MAEENAKFTPESTKVTIMPNRKYVLASCPYCGYQQYEARKRHLTECCDEDCGKEFIVDGS